MSPSSHMNTKTDPVFKTFSCRMQNPTIKFSCYVEFRMMDKVHKPSDSHSKEELCRRFTPEARTVFNKAYISSGLN
jgi:hypothetical protein